MGWFGRKPSRPDVPDFQSASGLEVIRRIKVTTDRYWVTGEQPADAVPAEQAEPSSGTKEVRDVDSSSSSPGDGKAVSR